MLERLNRIISSRISSIEFQLSFNWKLWNKNINWIIFISVFTNISGSETHISVNRYANYLICIFVLQLKFNRTDYLTLLTWVCLIFLLKIMHIVCQQTQEIRFSSFLDYKLPFILLDILHVLFNFLGLLIKHWIQIAIDRFINIILEITIKKTKFHSVIVAGIAFTVSFSFNPFRNF